MSLSNALDAFHSELLRFNLSPPTPLVVDGEIHHFSTNGKRSDKAGWYVLHEINGREPFLLGFFGCFRDSINERWCSRETHLLTPTEKDQVENQIKAHAEQYRKFREEKATEARQRALEVWGAASHILDGQSHPYLNAKGIKPHGLKVKDQSLVIPLMDVEGVIHSLQYIHPDGSKRFLSGGRVKGCFYTIGTIAPQAPLLICEGFATGASLHEATGYPVIVAFNAGNLTFLSNLIRQQYPDASVIICADDDHQTEGNPGLTKGREAAQNIGARLAVPVFSGARQKGMTDFNDLHQWQGLDSVKRCIDEAITSPPVQPLQAPNVALTSAPTPLPEALPSVMAFDFDLLPSSLHGWIKDISTRMQCPPDFAAIGAIVALSSLIGARAVIAPKARDDWRVVPNLWGLVVGRPGVMKSPALSEVLKPVKGLEKAERERHEEVLEQWAIDSKLHEMVCKQREKKAASVAHKSPDEARALLMNDDVPQEPHIRRYIVNDSTVEKLADVMTTNPWGLLVYRDEIHGLLTSMDKQGQEGARAFYLQSYDGDQGYTVDRIERGTHHLSRVCTAMLGGIQPGKIQTYVREAMSGGASDDGLLQRFGLAVWPDIEGKFVYIDQWPDSPAKQQAYAVFDRLNQLQPLGDEPQTWRFSDDAQEIFKSWLVPFEIKLRSEEMHPALVSHLSKYRKLVPALALIFALIDTPESHGLVNRRELLRALAWSDYLTSHAERLYAAAINPDLVSAHALLAKLREGKLRDADEKVSRFFALRDVVMKHWANLSATETVKKAADLLVEYGWLTKEVIPTGPIGGRPSERYQLHPCLLDAEG